MTIKLAVIMDPIHSIKREKDTTFAMLLAAQQRGWTISYLEQQDIYLSQGKVWAEGRPLSVRDEATDYFTLGEVESAPLANWDVVLMRKDPPFDMEYIYTTYLLEQAEAEGVLVVNRPQSLRDANEKLYTAWFPHCTPETLVSRKANHIKAFIDSHEDIIIKPLEGMGGASIFRIRQGDPNVNVIIETLTDHGRRYAMVQRFIPEISQGDKRIIVIDGDPIPYTLARIPAEGETRGNLAVGGTGVGQALSERDREICAQLAPTLREKGLIFVGLDVIGDYLTEINVTSPTGVRELDRQFNLDIGGQLMDVIASKLRERDA